MEKVRLGIFITKKIHKKIAPLSFVDVLCVSTKNIMQMWNWNLIAKAFVLQMLIVCITFTI